MASHVTCLRWLAMSQQAQLSVAPYLACLQVWVANCTVATSIELAAVHLAPLASCTLRWRLDDGEWSRLRHNGSQKTRVDVMGCGLHTIDINTFDENQLPCASAASVNFVIRPSALFFPSAYVNFGTAELSAADAQDSTPLSQSLAGLPLLWSRPNPAVERCASFVRVPSMQKSTQRHFLTLRWFDSVAVQVGGLNCALAEQLAAAWRPNGAALLAVDAWHPMPVGPR